MKKSKLFLILLFMVILLISGCKDDSISESVFEPPIPVGFIYVKYNTYLNEDYSTKYFKESVLDIKYELTNEIFSSSFTLNNSIAEFSGQRQFIVENQYYYLGNLHMDNKDYIATFIVVPDEGITGRAFTEDYSEVYEIDIRDITQ